MGQIDVVKRLKEIFADEDNFDESGFAKAELVTPEFAEGLTNISEADLRKLLKMEFWFSYFTNDKSAGIVHHSVEKKKRYYMLKLYYDQKYPNEVVKGVNEHDGGTGTGAGAASD